MFNFFRKSPKLKDFAFLACDMHSHLLPGIDDGAKSLEESLTLIRALSDLGFQQLFTTPHIMADLYPNTPEIIAQKEQEVQKAIAQAALPVQLQAAAEYLLDEAFAEKVHNKILLPLPGNRVLIETNFIAAPPQLDQLIFQLQAEGYQPVLAHPERYLYFHKQFNIYHELRERGVELQLNLLSLTGYYGKPELALAHRLLKEKLIDFLGTDLHHQRHLLQLQKLLGNSKAASYLLRGQWKNEALMR